LTGMRDDGTEGLRAIVRSGGIAVAQDPDDAAYPDMPRSAIGEGLVHHVVPLAGMAKLIASLARQNAPAHRAAPDDIVREAHITASYATSRASAESAGPIEIERSLLFAIRTLEERSRLLQRMRDQVKQDARL